MILLFCPANGAPLSLSQVELLFNLLKINPFFHRHEPDCKHCRRTQTYLGQRPLWVMDEVVQGGSTVDG